jgi:hypothetical protein
MPYYALLWLTTPITETSDQGVYRPIPTSLAIDLAPESRFAGDQFVNALHPAIEDLPASNLHAGHPNHSTSTLHRENPLANIEIVNAGKRGLSNLKQGVIAAENHLDQALEQ